MISTPLWIRRAIAAMTARAARRLRRPAKAIRAEELVPMKTGRMPGIDDGVGECDEERGSWRNAGIRVGIPSRTEVKQNQ